MEVHPDEATSSRSHCIFSMEIVHKIWNSGNRTQLRSKVQRLKMADLWSIIVNVDEGHVVLK